MPVIFMFRLLITYTPGALFSPLLIQYAICQQLTVSQITTHSIAHAVSEAGKNET